MSEPIKQTLFRFRTMRAPELLSSEAKSNYFIEHYDGTSGVFFAAESSMAGGAVLKDVMATTAASFSNKKTKDEIIVLDSDLYDFGLLLLKKRKTITHTEAAAEVAGLSQLMGSNRQTVWDNLFYQTVTQESGYVREALLVMLLGSHIVANFSSIPTTDSDMQKWAGSRVVLPLKLFEVPEDMTGSSTVNDGATHLETLHTHLTTGASKKLIAQIDTLKEELEVYKTDFYKTNDAAEKLAIETYQSGVQTALDNATKTDFVDQFSQFTFKTYSNYSPPSFTYSKPDEISAQAMGHDLSTESEYIMQKYDLYRSKSFEELESKLESIETGLHTSLFEGTRFHQEKIAIDGTLISKCDGKKRHGNNYPFAVQLVERSTGHYGILMSLDVGADCLKLESAETSVSIPQAGSHSTRKFTHSNGIVTVDLTDDTAIDFAQNSHTSIDLSSNLTFSNGLSLSFPTANLAVDEVLNGFLAATSSTDSGPELEIPSGYGLRRLGIADYRRLEQTLCCYVPGEVSHIENLMAREYKERSTRRFRRKEETTSSSSTIEKENLTDTSSTSRFDMQKEVSSILSESKQWGINAGFGTSSSGSYSNPVTGDVDFSVNADFSANFSTNTSSEESSSQATSFAKDVTERALNRVVSNVTEERIQTAIEEFEERNQHGFDNRQGAEHVSGVFRWVDKVYKNEIHNYGKRLQYEFMIPEPAEYHLLTKSANAASATDVPLIQPFDPRTNSFGSLDPIRNSAHILESNYHQWAAVYGATVNPAPDKNLTLSKTLTKPEDGKAWHESSIVKEQLVIPEGYGIDKIFISLGGERPEEWSHVVVSAAGHISKYWNSSLTKWLFTGAYATPELVRIQGELPLSADFIGFKGGTVSFTVKLIRKHSLMEEWQLDTFNAIMSAYDDRLQDYKDGLAELRARQGILMGDNPAFYRRIENTVLKKNCISYLTGDGYLGQDHTVGSETTNHQVNLTAAMDKYAASVKFFEQAFEWNLMSYNFYDYFWGNRDRWEELYNTDNDDALFRSFLRSGMARVVVTVRPGFEEAVMYYIRTGLIWNGGAVPLLDDEMYLSIVEELSESEYVLEDSWETRVPSTLTLIQAKTIALEAEGLPCYCDSENPPVEDIKEPTVNPLENLTVFIEGNTTP